MHLLWVDWSDAAMSHSKPVNYVTF